MKSLIALAVLFVTTTSFASWYTTQSFSKIFYADTEAQLVQDVEAAIPAIEAGEDKDLSFSMRAQQCSPIESRYIKIGKLFIKKVYKKVDGVLVPQVRGMLVVSHTHCFESVH
jgi:hypothetical protein